MPNSIPLPPRQRLKLDDLLRELSADAVELPRMLGLAPIEEHLKTEFTYSIQVRADVVARLADGSVLHLEWQSRNDTEMGKRMLDTRRGIEKQIDTQAKVEQIVVRVDPVTVPAPVTVNVAGNNVEFAVRAPQDLDLGPLFASSAVGDKLIACILTLEPTRILSVHEELKQLPEARQVDALNKLALVLQFRQDRGLLPEEIAVMVTDIIEIKPDNPLVRAHVQKEAHEKLVDAVIDLLTLTRDVDDEERARLASLDIDALEQLKSEIHEDLKTQFRPSGHTR